MNDAMLANVCKHNVTRFPYEISRLAQDLAGGVMVTMPSDADFRHETVGPILAKYMKGKHNVPVEYRQRILRLIENMTLGRNAVGYLTESLHGAGSPQARTEEHTSELQSIMRISFSVFFSKKKPSSTLTKSMNITPTIDNQLTK